MTIRTGQASDRQRQMYTRAAVDAFVKLDPRCTARNPVMFVVEVVSVLGTGLWVQALLGHGEASAGFIGAVTVWLWFTVLFANFSEALASPTELKRSALRGQLFNVVCDAPFDAAALLEGLTGIYDVALHGADIHVLIDPSQHSAEQVASRLREAMIEVSNIQPIEPTLEDVFISLIGAPAGSSPTSA